jgi:GT2 family glycosyltransferase
VTPESEPSPDALVAQIGALRALVERQRLFIGSMRASRFWKLRDWFFAVAARFGIRPDPLPIATAEERAITEASLGDAYQLFRLRHRRSEADAAWLRGLAPLLAVREPVDLVLDARDAGATACAATLATIRAQIYPHWRVRVWLETTGEEEREWLAAAARADDRVDAQPWNAATAGEGALGVIEAGDGLEPEALLLVAIELHGGADVVYTDEDRLRADGVCDRPQFKPDWSPETELTRDYAGRLCVFRASALAAAGGLDLAAGSAVWYDALLRVAGGAARVAHVPRVMYHRREPARPMTFDDRRRSLIAALERMGEHAEIAPSGGGVAIAFEVPAHERVAVIVPTRDSADLLEACVASVFARTLHRNFELIVVDNGSVETATRDVLTRWCEREPARFRVIRDDGAFNYSRLNNMAVSATDAPYVILLNNDTEVIAPEWMTAMLGQARRAPIGAVGALLLYDDGTIQHAGVVLGGVLGLAGHAYRTLDPDSPTAPDAVRLDTNYLAVTGACLMVARAKFEEVGGLDESFAVAFNDVDLCLKLNRAGYRNVLVPRARLHHYESKSRGEDDTRAKQLRARAESDALRGAWPDVAARDPYYNPNLTLDAEDFSVRL